MQPVANASTTVAKISQILAAPNLVYVYPEGGVTAVASCGSGNSTLYSFNPNSTNGKEILALLMTAYALGNTVTIWGTGACTVQSTTETLDYVRASTI